jgi:Cu-Zn family superoxide dismutase
LPPADFQTTSFFNFLKAFCSAMISVGALAFALIVASLNYASAAKLDSVYASASFDDKISFIISNDGISLEGTLFINQNITSSNTISVMVYPYGDIASSGGLSDGSPLASFQPSNSYSCSNLPCQVLIHGVKAGDWCAVIGKGVSISVDGVDVGIKAVFGIGQLGGGNCTYATSYNSQPAFAIAKVLSVGTSSINGTVIFQLADDALSVSGVISGLNASTSHGVHVHTFGDVRDIIAAENTGSHLAYLGMLHALVNNASRHTGDLGNIVADANGVACFNILVPNNVASDTSLTLLARAGSAIGRAIIIHALQDDGVTQSGLRGPGQSGARLGQGVIGYADTASSDAVLALMQAGGSSFSCGCMLTDDATGITYNGFCEAKDCKQQSWTALILVVTIGPLSVLLVLALMKFQTWRTSSISSKKVGVVKWSAGKHAGGDQSLPLLSPA